MRSFADLSIGIKSTVGPLGAATDWTMAAYSTIPDQMRQSLGRKTGWTVYLFNALMIRRKVRINSK